MRPLFTLLPPVRVLPFLVSCRRSKNRLLRARLIGVPVVAAPEALAGPRRGDDSLAAGAAVDHHLGGVLGENAFAGLPAEDSDSRDQCRCDLGVVLRAPAFADADRQFFARPCR